VVERGQLARSDPAVPAGTHGSGRDGLIHRQRRAVAAAAAPAGVAFAAVAGVAAANGGYFPTDFGWAALAFLVAAMTAVLVGERLELCRLDWLLVAGLAAIAGWTALSAAWSPGVAQPLLEAERTLGYAAAALVFLLVTPRRRPVLLPAGLLAAIAAVSVYALTTHLFPDSICAAEPGAGCRLAEPIGYSNALGVLVAMGMLLAVGFAADAASPIARMLAAGALPGLAATLLFTFSRGGWLALAVGAVAALALHRERLRFGFSALVLAAPAALAVWAASSSEALTRVGSPLDQASSEGRRLAAVLAALVVASALLGLGTARVERRLRVRGGRLLAAAALAALGVAAGALFVGAVARGASPASDDLTQRLLSGSSSSRGDYWRVAANEYAEHPWLGAGAGSFERVWLERRPVDVPARDAHSLYVETLSELGPTGLVLVLAVLALPLAAVRSARRQPFAAAVAGAYLAFVAHAGVDWDWELPAVTLTGIGCGVALLAWGRAEEPGRTVTARLRLGGLVLLLPLTAAVFVLHVSNTALLNSSEALARGDAEQAQSEARKARRWAPWSAEAWQRLGEAQLASGDREAARLSFRRALERDASNWTAWYDLAVASDGSVRERALARALRLNPLSSEARELRAAS
jgi:O-antigen ligase